MTYQGIAQTKISPVGLLQVCLQLRQDGLLDIVGLVPNRHPAPRKTLEKT